MLVHESDALHHLEHDVANPWLWEGPASLRNIEASSFVPNFKKRMIISTFRRHVYDLGRSSEYMRQAGVEIVSRAEVTK